MIDIPELVLIALSELDDRGDLASTARVCRLWSEILLDLLWETVFNLSPLCRVLAPMRYIEREGLWEFTTGPNQVSWRWDRWAFYAPRIRQVIITEHLKGMMEHPTAPEAIQLLISSMPQVGRQFPQPTAIFCEIDKREKLISQCFPLISPTLRSLDIAVLRNATDAAFNDLMQSLAQSPASLQTLSFIHTASRPFPSLVQCISRHSSTLSNVTLETPYERNTWRSICGLPKINTLNFNFYPVFSPNFPTPGIVDVLKELAEGLSGR